MYPPWERALTSAPQLPARSFTMSELPCLAAQCSAVNPEMKSRA